MGWITKNLTARTAGTPLAVYEPTAYLFAQYTRHVVFQGFSYAGGDNGHLYELYCSNSDDWHVKDLTTEAGAPAVATVASGYIFATEGSQHVVYQGIRFDGHVHELWWAGDGWQHNDLTVAGHAPNTQSAPFGFETHYDGTQRVVYRGRDSHIHQLSNSTNGWHDIDISAATGSPATSAIAAPTGYSFEAQGTAHVLARTEDGHILEYWQDASAWHWGDLTVSAGAPPAYESDIVRGYVYRGEGSQHVDYVGADQHVHELWWDAAGWHHNDLTASTGASPAALGSHPFGYAFESQSRQPVATQHVIYQGSDRYIHELWWDASGWHVNELTSAAAQSFATNSDVQAFVEPDNASQNVYYQSDAHQIIQLRWTP
ncbi:hypothetical protein GCM10027406_23900 [Leifsonia lichenia]